MFKPRVLDAGFLSRTFRLLIQFALLMSALSAGAQDTDEFQITNVVRTTSSVELQWPATTNYYYSVWWSDSVPSDPQYAALNLKPATNGGLSFIDTGDLNGFPPRSAPESQRFYQILRATNKIDLFGIKILYRGATNADAKAWYSTKWHNGHARSFRSEQTDPDDPWLQGPGAAKYDIDGKGILSVSPFSLVNPPPPGTITNQPRLHIIDPKTNQWHYGLECTIYAMRLADFNDTNYSYAGIEMVVRTDHRTGAAPCDTRGLGARMRYDGHTDFEKETSHPYSTAMSSRAKNNPVWPGGMPTNVWIGYKFVVFDHPDGTNRLELYLDLTNGDKGGDWQRVDHLEDSGKNFGVGGTNCATGIDPAMQLTESPSRTGSVSLLPNLTVRIRTDDIKTNGMIYKKASIREITP